MIAIKWMEKLPATCRECPFCHASGWEIVYFSCKVKEGWNVTIPSDEWNKKRDDRCPLVEVETESKWIPVSERLPKKGESVLVTLNDDILSEWERRDVIYVEIASYDEKANYYEGLHFFDSEWERIDTVTAWMPLPKPYKVFEWDD